MTFTLDPQFAAVLEAALVHNGPPPQPPAGDVPTRRTALDAMVGYLHLRPGVPHEYDAIAFNADVSRRAQGDRDRVLRSL
jgi:hypothetical protein